MRRPSPELLDLLADCTPAAQLALALRRPAGISVRPADAHIQRRGAHQLDSGFERSVPELKSSDDDAVLAFVQARAGN